ncbi:hypothetical protein PCC21_033890 [Pectobacterium carotovorum subsp. carotovorum PCC21]|nr:hypothetical protein PCC21_033890 [Pectobacterium carotovorum subsp. carotovorum PCC21]
MSVNKKNPETFSRFWIFMVNHVGVYQPAYSAA